MACETTYPVGEGITNLVLTLVNNIGGGIFLLIQMVPNIGKYYLDVLILSQHQAFVSTWVHPWFLVGSVLLIFLVCCVVLCYVLFVFVLRLMYPNVDSISGLSILGCRTSVFSN